MTTDKASTANLATRMLAVMTAIDGVAKTGTMEGHGNYAFVEAAVVARLVRAECAKQGIAILVSAGNASAVGTVTSRGGTLQTITRVEMDIKFVNVNDPTDWYLVTSIGDGLDDQDKGVFKAMTGALKVGLRNAFLIPDANDPERDQDSAAPPDAKPRASRKATPEAVGELMQPVIFALASQAKRELVFAKSHEAGLDEKQFKAMATMLTTKESSKDWTTQDADKVVAALATPMVDLFKGAKFPEKEAVPA